MIGRIVRNRWVRRIGLTLFLLVLLVAGLLLNAHLTLRHRGEQHRDSVLANLDGTDPGWRWEDIETARKKDLPPPEKNVIEQAVKLRDRFPKDEYGEWLKADTGDLKRRAGELPSADELARARKLVDACRDLIPEARGLRHLSGGVVVPLAENPIATLLPHVQKPREVAQLLQQDALVSAADGRPDDALDDALAMLAMAGGLDDEPFLIAQLVRLALGSVAARTVERTLWLGEPSEAKLAEVQAALTAAAKVKGFVTALRGERAGVTRLADFLEKDPGQASGLLPTRNPPPKAATAVVVSTLLPETQARLLEVLTRAITVAEKPPGPERDEEFAQIEKDATTATDLEGEGVKLFFPAVAKCYQADVRTTALLLAAAAAVEAERHRLKTGDFPNDSGFRGGRTVPTNSRLWMRRVWGEGLGIYFVEKGNPDDGWREFWEGSDKPGATVGVRLLDVKNRRKKAEEPSP